MRQWGKLGFRLARTLTIAALAVGVLAIGSPADAQQTQDGSAAEFRIADDPQQVVVRYVERFGELNASDYPSLHVYADGRVVRHRPAYMRRQGDFVGQLSRVELQQLVRTISDAGILEFDGKSARLETDAARRRRAIETIMTDPSVIELEVRLSEYRPSKSAAARQDVRQLVEWTGLRYDAQTFQEIPEVQQLNTVVQHLNRLAELVEQTGSRVGGVR